MSIYLVTFFISTYLYSRSRKNEQTINVILQCLSIMLPVLLAGLRIENLGQDMEVYGIPIFYNSISSHSFFDFINENFIEFGYSGLNYICSHISSDIHFFLCVHSFLVLLPIYLTANKFNKRTSIFILAFFYLSYYNSSFSMMRQSIAISWIIYGTTFLKESTPKKFVFVLAVAFAQLFHSSSILAVVIPLLLYLTDKLQGKMYVLYGLIIGFVLICFMFFYSDLGTYAIIVSSKYEGYFEQSGFNTHKVDLVIYIVIFIMTYAIKAPNSIMYKYVRVFSFLVIGVILLGSLFETANRLVYNISAPIWLYGSTMSVYAKSNKLIARIMLGLCLFSYIYSVYYINNYQGTVPYESPYF